MSINEFSFTSIYFLRAIIILFLLLITFQLFFKNLGVDIKDVKPTSLLKDRKREIDGNPDFNSGNICPHNQVELPINADGQSISHVCFCFISLG